MRRIWGALMCMGVLGGCATQPPRWAGQMWQGQGKMYFTGISSCVTVPCAYREAYEQALVSVAQYIGNRLSVHTTSRLDNNGTELEMKVDILSKQLELEKVQVEKFNARKQGRKWMGYVLVSVEKAELARAERRWQAKEQERLRQRQVVLNIQGERKLAAGVAETLRQAGFQTGKSNRTLRIEQTDFSCMPSQLQPLFVSTLGVQVQFESKQGVFQTRGYGVTCAQAQSQAVEQSGLDIVHWLEELL